MCLFSVLLASTEGMPVWLQRSFEFVEPYWVSTREALIGEDLLLQAGVVVGVLALSWLLLIVMRPLFKRLTSTISKRDDWVEGAVGWVSANLLRFLTAGLLWAVSLWFDARNEALAVTQSVEEAATVVAKNYILIRAVASISTLLLLYRAVPAKFRDRPYFRVMIWAISLVLVMNLLGIWEGISEGLDRILLLPIADSESTRVTALTILKGIFVLLILIPLASWFMRFGEGRVKKTPSLTPALQMLVIKVLKALVIVGAVLFGISSMGIDLSALAFLGGAVGLGLGFGFQKVVSNLISGVILLSDRSIKPGDVIEVDNTYGWINKLSARYVSVITRDGMEHLIPNETLITEKVTNWSFSDDMVRVRVPFGVSYHSDIHKVMELAIEAGKSTNRVLPDKEPVCWLLGFGDSSVDFELRVWIRDPANGLNNLRSAIYVKLWDSFKEHQIEIPFPQRDLNLRGGAPIEVIMKQQATQQVEQGGE
ncbi:mechanosensitive ion channel family protein [Pelagicoccus albus]|uniref:Mechanosensitive ion channel n=1 Tax=Pelagicoccus albus TaxID=415222 RepID=A0A7X1E8P7_9BACT|nr:mechanosensitive ion channel domain-containing protein [Pelagicoccus albus]MBC2606574.1 mechanosensitive ion channel [Pelagicoccus albus]